MRRPLAFAVLAALSLWGRVLAAAAPPTPTPTPTLVSGGLLMPFIVNGQVLAVARHADHAILGGTFSYVGPHSGAAAMLDGVNATADTAFPVVNGSVKVIVADGAGGWYLGGNFAAVAGVPSNHLIHVHSNGSVDPTFTPDPNGPVSRLTRGPSGQLYVAGAFSNIGGVSDVGSFVRLDATGAWNASFAPPAINTSEINVLLAHSSGLYVGGTFVDLSGTATMDVLARLDLDSGALDLAFDPNVDQMVTSLQADAGGLYVGGAFNSVTAYGLMRVAFADGAHILDYDQRSYQQHTSALALDGAGWLYAAGYDMGLGEYFIDRLNAATGARDGGFAASANAAVNQLAFDGASTLYAQGGFTSVNGGARNGVAALNAGSGAATGFQAALFGGITESMALAPSGLYLGGAFVSAGGRNTYGLARVHLDTAAIDMGFPATDGQVNELKVHGSNLFVGGNFTTIGGLSRPYLAKVDLGSGTVAGAFAPAPNGRIDAMDTDAAGDVYAAGIYSSIGGQFRSTPAKLNQTDGSLMAEFPPVNVSTVEDLALGTGTDLYLAGHFTSVGGLAISRAAKVNVSTGAVVSAFNPAANDNLFQIQPDGGASVYLAGRFTTLGGVSHQRVAKVSAATGLPEPGFSASADGAVNGAYVGSDSRPVFGGEFSGKIRRLDPGTGATDSISLTPANNIGAVGPGRNAQEVLVGFINTSTQTWGSRRVAGFGLFRMAPPVVATATPTVTRTPATSTPTPTATPTASSTASPTPIPASCGGALQVLGTGAQGSGPLEFDNPQGLLINLAGNLVVGDMLNHRLVVYDLAGNTLQVIGSQGAGAGQFQRPAAVAQDGAGNYYVADAENHRVQKLDSAGNHLGMIGTGLLDPAANLYLPQGVAVDVFGNIFVSDRHHRVLKYDSSFNHLATLGKPGNLSGTAMGEFSSPGALLLHGGLLFVADSNNHRVQALEPYALTAWAQFGSPGSAAGQFNTAGGMTGDGWGLWVTDVLNHRIQKFAIGGYVALEQVGSNGSAPGEFNGPLGVALDGNGHLWVADRFNHRVQKLDTGACVPAATPTPTPFLTATMTGSPTPGVTMCMNADAQVGTTGSAGAGATLLNGPAGLAFDNGGNLYVADMDNHRVTKRDANGAFVAEFGTQGVGPDQFQQPIRLAVDAANGWIYVTEWSGFRVNKFDLGSLTSLTRWGSSGAANGQFGSLLEGVAVGLSATVYVADRGNHRIQRFDSDGNFIQTWGSNGSAAGSFNNPTGVGVGDFGSVFVADTFNHRVQKFDANGAFLAQWGVSGSAPGQLQNPRGLSVGADGLVYVADSGNHRVQAFTQQGALVRAWGQAGSGPGDLNFPQDAVRDASGRVWVSEWNPRHRVQRFAEGACFTATPSATATPTLSPTGTATTSATPTATGTDVQTVTSTVSPTPTASGTPVQTVTSTVSPTPTASGTPVQTVTSTVSPTSTASGTPVQTVTSTISPTPTASGTPVQTVTSTASPVQSATATASPTPSRTPGSPVVTATPGGTIPAANGGPPIVLPSGVTSKTAAALLGFFNRRPAAAAMLVQSANRNSVTMVLRQPLAQPAKLTVLNSRGKAVGTVTLAAGTQVVKLNTAKLPPGRLTLRGPVTLSSGATMKLKQSILIRRKPR